MSAIKDGGPAFPVPNNANVNGQEGMTLRDYFAAKAMHAAISAPHRWTRGGEDVNSPEGHAALAYDLADAMLRAREVKA